MTTDPRIIPAMNPEPTDAEYIMAAQHQDRDTNSTNLMLAKEFAARRVAAARQAIEWAIHAVNAWCAGESTTGIFLQGCLGRHDEAIAERKVPDVRTNDR